jgi:hypothetical protein
MLKNQIVLAENMSPHPWMNKLRKPKGARTMYPIVIEPLGGRILREISPCGYVAKRDQKPLRNTCIRTA